MNDLMTEKEAAAYLKLSANTLPSWRCRGQGPAYIKLGRSVRYRKSALDQYLEEQTVETGEEHRNEAQ
jgi:excisionase family DNA binding protein